MARMPIVCMYQSVKRAWLLQKVRAVSGSTKRAKIPEYLEREAARKRVEHERMMERIIQQQKEDEEQEAAKMQERRAKWEKVVSLINMDRLNEIERKFVTESVRNYILADRKLTDKQRAWLHKIMLKYPARR